MPKPKKQLSGDNGGIKIKVEKSSVAEFTRRPLPNERELKKFEEFVGEEAGGHREAEEVYLNSGNYSDKEIDESLNEIYQDDDGEMVDVKRLTIKKKHGFFFWFFSFVFFSVALAGGGYAAYNYYLQSGSDATAVDFAVSGEPEVTAGQEFFYTLQYKNLSNIAMRHIRIKATYPDNFIFLDSLPAAVSDNSVWIFDQIPPHHSGKIKVKGMMIGRQDAAGVILANLTYSPENFSSEFKKQASFTSVIRDIGLDFNFDYIATALLGEESDIKLKIRSKENNFINNFRLTMELPENAEFINTAYEKDSAEMIPFSAVRPGVWQVSGISDRERYLPIKLKFIKKTANSQEVPFRFDYFDYIVNQDDFPAGASTTGEQAGRYFTFFEGKLNFEVMKSDLNLNIIVNGSSADQGVNFGQTLNYSIVYKNKGETDMKDVVIMAVLESDFLDWTTLQDGHNGREEGNTISWSKEEIPELAEVKRNQEGVIDFAVNVGVLGEVNPDKDYRIKSYAQFSLGEGDQKTENADNRSNIIINKINSDLKLGEQVRYFNQDNIPVGTGPQPPKVGQTTSYKVYWDLSNNLHELSGLKVTVKLPEYVNWNKKERSSVGGLEYKPDSREVIWNIGRLPITVYRASAEFSISVTPREKDKNTIMVLLPGSFVEAVDVETGETIGDITKAKTTKLEDDDIAAGDGIVE